MKISRNIIFAALVSATIFAGCASTKQKVVSVAAPIISSEDLRLALEPKISTDYLSAVELYEKGQQYENGDGFVQCYSVAQIYYEKAKEALERF